MDYIQQLINYIPWFVVLGVIVVTVRYGSKYAIEKMKIKKAKEKEVNKPKSLFDTIIDGISQAPQAKTLLDNEIANLMSKGATEEQLKSLKSKKQMVDLLASMPVQMLGVPAVDFIKTNIKPWIRI